MTQPTSPDQEVRRFYQALAGRDLEAAAAGLHPEVVLHVPGQHRLAGDHHGIEAVVRFVLDSRAATVGGEQVDVIDVLAGRDHAAALLRVTGERADGARLDNTTVHLVRSGTDGRIAEVWLHNRDQDHVDAFWGVAA